MQVVDRPALCPSKHCLHQSNSYVPSNVRLSSARNVAAPCLRKWRRRRGSAICCSTATSTADRTVTHLHSSGGAASRLVQSLADNLDCMKKTPLSPACSLSIYKLTKLCTAYHQYEVLSVLARDSETHNGHGVFLHVVQLLQQNEDAASQSLAADLVQAMLSGHAKLISTEIVSVDSKVLNFPSLHDAFDCTPLLQAITSSSNLKVKTAAVLVLLLMSVGDSDGHRKVSDSGAVAVMLLEMLSEAGSWQAPSAQLPAQLPAQSPGPAGMLAVSKPDPALSVTPEITAALPFMEACSALLHCLFQGQLSGNFVPAFKLQLGTLKLGLAANLAFSLGTCNWRPTQHLPAAPRSPVAKLLQWWCRQFPVLTLPGWPFHFLGFFAFVNILTKTSVSASRMLWLTDQVRRQQRTAKRLIEGSYEDFGLELAIKLVTAVLLGAIDTPTAGVGQHLGHDAVVRRITPSLLALLEHPVEARRAFAAEYASLLGIQASGVVFSALLSSDTGLSTLLQGLSADDKPVSRSHYAGLIACCADHRACDAAALDKIRNSGAVPQLLRLLRETEGSDQKVRVVQCLERLARANYDMMTSMVVHGGTQQLLDLVQAGIQKGSNGQVQLNEESQDVTQFSIQTLFYMLREPAAAADIIKADLAGLVLQIMQGPSLKSVTGFSTVMLNSLYGFSCQPEGRQQLLDRLTPDRARIIIELSLDALEAPDACHAALVFAAGLVQLAGEVPAGRQQLALPAVGPRMVAVLTSPGYRKAQGYVLQPLGLLAYLKPDGSYHPNPWLDEPSPISDPSLVLEASPPETPQQARQDSQPSFQDSRPSFQASTQASQLSSELDPRQLLAAASARLSQRSAAELAHATPSHGTATAGTAGSPQEQQSSTSSSVQGPQPCWGQGFQHALVQSAAALACNSPLPGSRFQAMSWLTLLVPQLTDEGCTDVANSEAVQASVRMMKQEAEPARTRAAAVEFCLALHDKGALPVAALLEAGVHQHLAKIVAQSDNRAGLLAPAGTLLGMLWQAQSPLVSEFVSQGNLPSLLKWAARMGSSSSSHCLVALTLVHRVWSFTASLVSEPLLLQAIPGIVQCCGQIGIAAASEPSADDWKLQADIQEEAVSLLCSMAEFPFYRPAIRKAEPARALTAMLQAGCSPEDGQQHRIIAQLALNLTHKLLKGDTGGSYALGAPDSRFSLAAASFHPKAAQSDPHSDSPSRVIHLGAAHSIMRMCKRGSIESRHAALTVLHQILVNRHGHVHTDSMQQGLISLGLMPLLFGIAQAPDTSPEMQAMADACLASVHSDQNVWIASFGVHCLMARLITITLNEQPGH